MNLKSYLTIFVIFSLITSLGFAFCGDGDGTIGNPYLICNWLHLNNTKLDLTAHYALNNSLNSTTDHYVGIGDILNQ